MNKPQRFKAPQRRPRAEWKIPLPETAERHRKKLEEEARDAVLTKGTTPHGREVLRKGLFTAEQMLRQGEHQTDEIVREVVSKLTPWQVLGREHSQILSRLWGGSEDAWFSVGPLGMARLIVLCITVLPDRRFATCIVRNPGR